MGEDEIGSVGAVAWLVAWLGPVDEPASKQGRGLLGPVKENG
jgi:hypothetical protein